MYPIEGIQVGNFRSAAFNGGWSIMEAESYEKVSKVCGLFFSFKFIFSLLIHCYSSYRRLKRLHCRRQPRRSISARHKSCQSLSLRLSTSDGCFQATYDEKGMSSFARVNISNLVYLNEMQCLARVPVQNMEGMQGNASCTSCFLRMSQQFPPLRDLRTP